MYLDVFLLYSAVNKTEPSVDSIWKVALKVIIFITLQNCSSPVAVLRIDSTVNKTTRFLPQEEQNTCIYRVLGAAERKTRMCFGELGKVEV